MPYDENGEWYDEEEEGGEEEAAEDDGAYEGEEAEPSPWEQFAQTQRYEQPLDYAGLPGAEGPMAEAMQPVAAAATPYQGQAAFPGLPVIMEGGQAMYNGRPMQSEAAAMQARSRHAADPRAQAAFQQHEQARQAAQQPGDATTPEMTSIQIRQEMDKNQLSRADQLELTQIQNGIARVQQDMREGRVPMAQGMEIQVGLTARGRPLMMRARTAADMRQALQIQTQMEQARRMSMQNVQHQQYADASAAGHGPPQFTDPNGRQWAQISPGHWQEVQPRREAAQPRSTLTPGEYDRIVDRAEKSVDRIMADPTFTIPDTFRALPGESPAARRERYRESQVDRTLQGHMRRLGVGEGDGQGQAGQPAAPRPIAADAPRERMPADQQIALQQFQDWRDRIDTPNGPLRRQEEREQFLNELSATEALYRQYGSLQAMPADARRTFAARVARFNSLLQQRGGVPRAEASRTTPTAAPAGMSFTGAN